MIVKVFHVVLITEHMNALMYISYEHLNMIEKDWIQGIINLFVIPVYVQNFNPIGLVVFSNMSSKAHIYLENRKNSLRSLE